MGGLNRLGACGRKANTSNVIEVRATIDLLLSWLCGEDERRRKPTLNFEIGVMKLKLVHTEKEK